MIEDSFASLHSDTVTQPNPSGVDERIDRSSPRSVTVAADLLKGSRPKEKLS
jgi:hypothetical protein